ncbi:MAG: N-acetylmuramoyl-L-alanine amidase [Oscillospiraceae bacterium]|nr:N-acetylmuramoyl-L-alanine amidase [Oscillospiraceae bacterium]
MNIKRRLKIFFSIILVCVLGLLSNLQNDNINVSTKAETPSKIILDAGHGGFDGGAVADDGTVEKDINLNITKNVCKMLKLSGFDVIMTRTEDIGTDSTGSDKIAERKKSDLKNRLLLMEKYPDAVYISIHLNKFTTSAANGAQVFYSKNSEESAKIAKFVQETIKNQLQPYNDRVIKQGTSATYLLHNATVPAVIVECGFLSNKRDLENLKTKEYQSRISFSILCGILEYFSEK